MARGSRRHKRPFKGLLAWVGLALLALVAAKKTVGRLMRHETADEGAATAAPDGGEGQLKGTERIEHVAPDDDESSPLLAQGLSSASDVASPGGFVEKSDD
jgi:hypothetical protein